MSRSYPDWVCGITDALLDQRFGVQTVARGVDYDERGRVGHIQVTSEQIAATVQGSGSFPYRVRLDLPGSADRMVPAMVLARMVSVCSCPMRTGCKHVVAVLVHMRRVQSRRRLPAWQRALAPVLPAGPKLTPSPAGGRALGLLATAMEGEVEFRLASAGPKGWVKGQLNWDSITYRHADLRMDHVEAVLRLRTSALQHLRERSGYYYGLRLRAGHLLLSEFGSEAWQLLAAARAAGVAITSDRKAADITWAEETVAVAIDAEGTADGGVRVHPRITLGGRALNPTPPSLVGAPPIGIVAHSSEGGFVAAAFEHPLTDAELGLLALELVEIPSTDLADFTFNFLPRLRQVCRVNIANELELPEPGVPTVLVVCRRGVEGEVRVDLGFQYGEGTSALRVLPSVGADSPVRDRAAEHEVLSALPDGRWRALLLGESRLPAAVTLAGRALLEAMDELADFAALPEVHVEGIDDVPRYRHSSAAPRVELSVDESARRDWFDLQVDVSIDGEDVPLASLIAALTCGEDHLLLESGLWFDLDRPELERLRILLAEAAGLVEYRKGTGRLSMRPENAGWWEELQELGIVTGQAETWRRAAGRLLGGLEHEAVTVPSALRATLRPYQVEGLRWMNSLTGVGLGGILADDMGLGKTVQALALVASLAERGDLEEPVLVVAPSSVVGAWAEQAAQFLPSLEVRVLRETSRKRGSEVRSAVVGAQLVLTTYAVLRLDVEEFEKVGWRAVLLDEAQFVKNPAARTYQAVRRLDTPVRFALTGTPIENNLMDLWSMLSLAAPGVFPDPKVFAENFRHPIEEEGDADALNRLLRRIRPLVLRRTKELVAPELPPRQEQVFHVELGAAHRRLYDRQLQRERQKVLGLVDDLDRNRFMILRSLTVLRQMSLAPSLVDEAHSGLGVAKLEVLLELLAEVAEGGHRALVFSQFTGFLKMAREKIEGAGISTVYLDGRTRKRQERIDEFRHGDAPVFLISLKAGGFGLTLTEADYVFVLDPWWNPAAEAQAVDRAHRIGQDKTVMVYRLVAQDTIEEKVVALQERKRALFQQVVDSARADDQAIAGALSADDIRGLLET